MRRGRRSKLRPHTLSGSVGEDRRKAAHGFQIAIDILSDEQVKAKARYWSVLSEALWKEHRREYSGLTSPEKVAGFYADWARGDYVSVLSKVWSVLGDLSALGTCGLVTSPADAFGLRHRQAQGALA